MPRWRVQGSAVPVWIVDQQRDANTAEFALAFAVDDLRTSGVLLDSRPIYGLFVPVCNGSPTITAEVSTDDATYYPLQDGDGTDSIQLEGGATAYAVNSEILAPLAGYCGLYLRFVFSVAQTGNRTLRLFTVS